MNSYTILVLAVAVGFNIVVANSVLKQTVADKELLLSESNDSSTNHEETLANNDQIEQKKIYTNVKGETNFVEDRPIEETVGIDIENIQSSIPIFDLQVAIDNNQFNLQEHSDTSLQDEFELAKESDYYYNDIIFRDPNEIMETAAGFVPIPIFRKRQKQTPRRQYATRRYNRRPYATRRRHYYPYYYRPSSLRYY